MYFQNAAQIIFISAGTYGEIYPLRRPKRQRFANVWSDFLCVFSSFVTAPKKIMKLYYYFFLCVIPLAYK